MSAEAESIAVTRKRPPELSLSGSRREGTTTSTPSLTSRQRNGTITSTSSLSPEKRKTVPGRSSSRRLRKKEEAVPFLSRLHSQLVASATAANVALEVQLRRHGRYISRHPIRTLLLACLIITSLFYPAAGIYLWSSKGGPGVTRGDARSVWRSLSTPFLDSFASSGRKHHNSLRDLRMVWDDAPDLRAVDARDADAYLGSITPLNLFPHSWPAMEENEQEKKCRSVRVEHVFVTTDDVMMGLGARFGALDTPILQSTLSLQDTIESYLTGKESGLACVRAFQSSDCLTLSPLSFWQRDAEVLARDLSPTATLLGSSYNVTAQGIPLSLTTTLAGRSHLFTKLPRADHLALTFFLEDEEDCSLEDINGPLEEKLSKGHERWLSMLRNITGGQVGILSSEINATKEVVLQFMPVHSSGTFLTQRLLLASGYIAVFIWLSKSLMKIQNVHSRFGLAFTGVIELIISMTLAVSICALCGVRLTLVPWEILPFVVVVIGSENMFVLTNAIISTPISLSVSSRIATGLEKVGVPIAVTVMSDVVLMTIIMMLVDVRAVREFCIFAIFSLFVDFFMQMTLYSTVLSIDLQRLELADLLSQGGGSKDSNNQLIPNIPDNESNGSEPSASLDGHDEPSTQRVVSSNVRRQTHNGSSFIKMSCRTMWRARTARTASLSLLLAFMFGIYLYHGSGFPSHHSYPFLPSNATTKAIAEATSTTIDQETNRFDPYSHLSSNEIVDAISVPWWHKSPSASFWQALNPNDASSVRIKVEPWTVLSLRSTKTFEGTQRTVAHFASWAIFRPRVRAIIWFSKLVILPICGTTGLLWVLLLYLLKDTELLEAQQNHSDGMGGDEEGEEMVEPEQEEGKIELETTVRISSTSHNSDVELVRQCGGFVVSLATDSSLSSWKPSKRGKTSTIILSAIIKNYSRVTAMEVDADSNLIAMGHASGSVSLWTLTSLQPVEVTTGLGQKSQQNGSVNEATIPSTQVQSLFILPNATERINIVSAHRDGSVWRWTRGSHQPPLQILAAQNGAIWMSFAPSSSQGSCRNILAFSSSDYRFQLYRLSNDAPYLNCLLTTRDCTSVVRCATMTTLIFGDEDRSRGNTWSSVVMGTSQGSVIVYDLISSVSVGQYDILDGAVTRVRAVDYVSACPLLAYAGNRDILLINSGSRATIMSLSTLAATSPILSANKSPLLTPFKRKNGLHSASVSVTEPVESIRTIENANGLSPKDSGPNATEFVSNGTIGGMYLDTHNTPLPLSVSNGSSRHRRMSSQGKRNMINEDPFTGDQPLPTASTIGSVLGHFDVDPFELHSTTKLQWARLASLECVRGGADLVMNSDGAKLFGVRKGVRQGLGIPSIEARWEAFLLDVNLLCSDRRPQLLSESTSVKQCRLDLEDGNLFDGAGGGVGESVGVSPTLPLRSIHFASPSRNNRITPSPLSFTRLNQVQAFYKDRSGFGSGVGDDALKKRKRTIILAFANSVAAVICSE